MVVSGMVIKVSRVEIWDEGRGTRPTAGGRRADGGQTAGWCFGVRLRERKNPRGS